MQYACWCYPFGNGIIWRYTICCQLSDKETSTIVFVKGPKVERLVGRTFATKKVCESVWFSRWFNGSYCSWQKSITHYLGRLTPSRSSNCLATGAGCFSIKSMVILRLAKVRSGGAWCWMSFHPLKIPSCQLRITPYWLRRAPAIQNSLWLWMNFIETFSNEFWR